MIRLGHIEYSNCLPPHARLIAEGPPPDVTLVTGVPSVLNRALARGEVDIAPCSSIEFARHADGYRILPDFVIGSDGPVHSIRFDSARPPEELHNETVLVTDSSATSVVLLRVLLERYWGVSPRFETFDQSRTDPLEAGAAAALFIGDVALRRPERAAPHVFDLGHIWKAWTGLPFAFAVWQVRPGLPDHDVARMRDILLDSRRYFETHSTALATRYAEQFKVQPAELDRYWHSLRYDLDEPMRRGLLRFLSLAAELGETPPVTELTFAGEHNATRAPELSEP